MDQGNIVFRGLILGYQGFFIEVDEACSELLFCWTVACKVAYFTTVEQLLVVPLVWATLPLDGQLPHPLLFKALDLPTSIGTGKLFMDRGAFEELNGFWFWLSLWLFLSCQKNGHRGPWF